jgi:tRNA(fMet)-specific endonuclease VapC
VTLYLPDTTVLIGFGRGRPAETDWMRRTLNSANTVISCAVTVAECLAGATPSERAGWREIFGALRFVPFDLEDAVLSGTYRYDLARQGRQIALGDSLIAAIARRTGAVIVTSNLKDFPMDDIHVEGVA